MKTLTEIVVALIEMMEAEEQKEFLEKMSQGKRPTKPPVPMTAGELWWKEKLNPQIEWATTVNRDDMLDDFIKTTGWEGTRHGARSSLGKLLKKLCPAIRRYRGDYLMPTGAEGRKAFIDVFPAPRRRGGVSGESGIPAIPLNIKMGPRI